jgi:hypothetical protein
VAYTDEGTRHLVAEHVDHVQEVTAVVQPGRYMMSV